MQREAAPAPSSRSLVARALVVCAVAAGVVLCCFAIAKAHVVFAMLFAAIVLGEALRPLADRLAIHLNRALSILLTFTILMVASVVGLLLPLQVLKPQLAAFARSLPAYAAQAAALLESWLGADARDQIGRAVAGNAAPIGAGLLGAQRSLASFISAAILIVLMAAFWLSSSASLRAKVLVLIAPSRRAEARDLFDALGRTLTGYACGVAANGAIVALASTVILWLLRAPYPVVLGLLQGALVAVPYLGTLIAVVVAGSVVLADQGWQRAALAIALLSLVEGLEGSFISPLIFKQSVKLDPLATVVATAIGGALLGVAGVVLAVPAAALLQTALDRALAKAVPSDSG